MSVEQRPFPVSWALSRAPLWTQRSSCQAAVCWVAQYWMGPDESHDLASMCHTGLGTTHDEQCPRPSMKTHPWETELPKHHTLVFSYHRTVWWNFHRGRKRLFPFHSAALFWNPCKLRRANLWPLHTTANFNRDFFSLTKESGHY